MNQNYAKVDNNKPFLNNQKRKRSMYEEKFIDNGEFTVKTQTASISQKVLGLSLKTTK